MDTGTTMPPQQMPPMPEAPKGGNNAGAMIGVAVIVIVLALGAAYFWMQSRPMDSAQDSAVTEDAMYAQPDKTAEALKQTSSSDAAADIEADLSSTDLGNIEAEMNAAANEI